MNAYKCLFRVRRLQHFPQLHHARIPSLLASGKTTRCFSSSSSRRQSGEKVYELRCYSIRPQNMKEFMEMSTEWMHLRLEHSKLIGYWTSEIGGINDVVHIWEYDSLSHRSSVRQSLAADPLWVGNYFSKLLPMLLKQDNSLLKLLPGTGISQPPSKGIYEIQHFEFAPLKVNDLPKSNDTFSRPGGALLGSFYTLIGHKSTGCQLWWHPDVDSVSDNQLSVDAATGIRLGHSRLLVPVPWSTLQ